MQLFTCPFDNDTSHVRLYLTLGMPLCRMTHICCHRNRRFQRSLCNWSWWIWPFLDNGAAQPRGHQRALTPSAAWRLSPAAGWEAPPDFQTSSTSASRNQAHHEFCVRILRRTPQSLREPIWQPAVLFLTPRCQDVSFSSCSPLHNPHPQMAPCSPWSKKELCLLPFIVPPPHTAAITAH